jgi:hypothetical protein
LARRRRGKLIPLVLLLKIRPVVFLAVGTVLEWNGGKEYSRLSGVKASRADMGK